MRQALGIYLTLVSNRLTGDNHVTRIKRVFTNAYINSNWRNFNN